MSVARHILIVSGSRADYNLLYWPMKLLTQQPDFRISVAVTGMHLADSFGHTVEQFERDGFSIAAQIPVLGMDDGDVEIARAIGRGVLGFADVLIDMKPDLVLVLGDRFEIFAAVQAAFVQRIPIAHICGGDVTNGSLDEAFRHAITKMSGLHFVTSNVAAKRVRQLGEMPERIFNVGSPGVDFIRRAKLMDRPSLEADFGHQLPKQFLLVAFHPVALDVVPSLAQVTELLAALSDLPPDIGLFFTFANADADGAKINEMILEFTHKRPQAYARASLGPIRFLSLMRLANAVVGNSSSGLYEAPSFDVPTVNIGRRQSGRVRATSVIDCPPEQAAIRAAIDRAIALKLDGTVNPYGNGTAAEQIVAKLKSIPDWHSLIIKEFRDLPDELSTTLE